MTEKRSLVFALIVFSIVVISLILLGYGLKGLNWDLIQNTAPKNLLVILVVSVLSIGIYTLEIYFLLRSSNEFIAFWKTYLVLTASMSTNYVTPLKVGIPLRVYLYNKVFNLSMGIGSALISIETLLGLLIPGFLSIVGIYFIFPDVSLLLPIVLLVILAIVVIIVFSVDPAQFIKFLGRMFSQSVTEKVGQFLVNLRKGFLGISVKTLAIVIFFVVLNLMVTSLRLSLIIKYLGGDADYLGVFFARVISVTFGSVSMIPMGLGVRDASVTFLLTNLGLSKEVAFTSALVERLFSPGLPLILGLISSNILGISTIKKRLDKQEGKE